MVRLSIDSVGKKSYGRMALSPHIDTSGNVGIFESGSFASDFLPLFVDRSVNDIFPKDVVRRIFPKCADSDEATLWESHR